MSQHRDQIRGRVRPVIVPIAERYFFNTVIFKEALSTMNASSIFAHTPPVKLFFFAAIPGSISMLASSLYYTFDGIFVGQYLDATAFAAINLALPFVIINFSLADLVGVGSAVPISIYLGRGEKQAANNLFTCACLLILILGAAIGGILYASAPGLIHLMGAKGDFAQLAIDYMRVYALCSPLTTIIFALDNYWRICGFIRGSMWLNILMSALCGGLEFLFLGIFGWGVWAAALAGSAGMAICALIAFVPFFRGQATLRFCRPHFHVKMIKQIVACGSPNFLNTIAGRLTSILMNAILVRLGGATAVSVYGVLMFADGFVQPLLYGLCDALQPAVGYNWGAEKYSRVRAIERCCFIGAAVVTLLLMVVLFSFPAAITQLFVPNADEALLTMSVTALQLFAFTYLTRWFSFATQSYMLAIERPLEASLLSISTAFLFPVLLVVLLWPLGLTGIWLNMPLTAMLAAVLAAMILRRLHPLLHQADA